MAKHTTANLRERDKELTLQHHETDSPLIPVAQIERLHQIRPDLVDWILQQTQIEGDYRRSESRRVNTFVFIERLIGQICAFLIGMAGIAGGFYVALTGLAAVFLTGRRGKSGSSSAE